MINQSELLRIQGNEKYHKSIDTLAPVLFQYNLNQAIILYSQALALSKKPSEQASLYKNLAMSYTKMNLKESDFSKQIDHLFQGYKHFIQAQILGLTAKKEEFWLKNIETEMIKAVRSMKFINGNDKIKIYFKLFFMIPDEIPNVKILISIGLARQLFNESIKSLDVKDYKSVLKMLADAQQPIETARIRLKIKGIHMNDDENLYEEIIDLKDSLITTEAQAKSLQRLEEANKLNQAAIFSEEFLNYDDVFKILDLYKEVILFSQGKDLESEANAFSAMGKIFYKILKNNKKAHDYFLQSINLAMALRPQSMEDRPWFKSAKLFLEEIQIEFQKSEDEKIKEERDKLAEKYAEELSEIENNAKKTMEEFLLFLFEKFKKPEFEELKKKVEDIREEIKKSKEGGDYEKKRKSVLLKTIRLFHPDKLILEKDPKINFLFREVARHLNHIYSVHFK